MKRCVLNEAKECVHCGDCDICDLDPNKICDNCCKCIDSPHEDENYAVLPVDLQTEPAAQEGWEDEYDIPDGQDEDTSFECDSDDDPQGSTYIAEPLDIDPELLLEWEQKLNESFAGTKGAGNPRADLRGRRKIKRGDLI